MNNTDTIRLLLGHSDDIEAQRLASMLNNSGIPNRAVQAESLEVFSKHLEDSAWDAIIVHAEEGMFSTRDAKQALRKNDLDIPIVALTEQEHHKAVIDGLKAGAYDVVPLDHDQHLLLVLKRALVAIEKDSLMRSSVKKAKELERRNQDLLDSSRDGVAFIEDGILLYANEAFANILGYDEVDDIDCVPIFDLISDSDHGAYRDFFKTFEADPTDNASITLTFIGSAEPLKLNISVSMGRYEDEDAVQLFLRHADELAVDPNSHIDDATGLLTRRALIEQAEQTLEKNHEGCWWQLRIENFDELSIDAGMMGMDQLLLQLGEQLNKRLPGLSAGRINDDNIALLHSETDEQVSLQALQTLVKDLEDHLFSYDKRTFHWHLHAALVPVTKGVTSSTLLIDRANLTLPKTSVDEPVKEYEPPLDDEQANRKRIVKDINLAIEDDRFKLQFQPIVSMHGQGNPIYEVLLRMIDENGEQVEAHKFITEAEQSGATSVIDRWTIRESLKVLATKKDNTKLVMNISAGVLQDEGFFDWLEQAITASQVEPALLTLQIRETVATEYMGLAQSFCQKATKLGLQICISHFGCVMNYIKVLDQLPIALVKLDQSYTKDLQGGNKEGITELLKSLAQKGILSVIPFIETASTLAAIWTLGVHFIQGHYLQAPSDDMNYDFEDGE